MFALGATTIRGPLPRVLFQGIVRLIKHACQRVLRWPKPSFHWPISLSSSLFSRCRLGHTLPRKVKPKVIPVYHCQDYKNTQKTLDREMELEGVSPVIWEASPVGKSSQHCLERMAFKPPVDLKDWHGPSQTQVRDKIPVNNPYLSYSESTP